MAEEAPTPQNFAVPPPAETTSGQSEVPQTEVKEPAAVNGGDIAHTEPIQQVATELVAPASPIPETKIPETANDKQPTPSTSPQDKPATPKEDVEMTDDIKPVDAAPIEDESAAPQIGDSTPADKSKARRKSGGVPEHKKKLNKKASKAKMTHTDAKPGDYFFVRLKGYPLWPAIVCDETMLPTTLLKSRPVTAMRPDGTYRADYEDGGNKVKDRTFAVMYLHTNEFGWIPNYDLLDLDFDTVGEVTSSMRKDLHAAHLLAAEKHDLAYFKEILTNFMEARALEIEAKEAAKALKKANRIKKKSKTATATDGEDEDVDMADAPAEDEEADAEVAGTEQLKKSKKRKAVDDAATPQRSDSVKKTKTILKLTTTPKANGTSTPQTAKDSTTKASKPKTKKAAPKTKEPEVLSPKEPDLTPEEKRQKKEKEILFLRHKLQKGLLTRDQEPKEEEMKQMSEFVSKLEGYADLEVAIIRATKINKVLKAILKLTTIPKEEEFHFKPRSQSLLDKWNKLLASEQGTPAAAPAPTTTNGVSEEVKPESEEAKAAPAAPTEATNGVRESSSEAKAEEQASVVEEPVAEAKEAPKVEDAPAPPAEPIKESIAEPTPVESTA